VAVLLRAFIVRKFSQKTSWQSTTGTETLDRQACHSSARCHQSLCQRRLALPTRLSRALGVTHKALQHKGVYDAFIDVDSKLYVDPYLLGSTTIPELKGAKATFARYFEMILKLLRASKRTGDVPWLEAHKRLQFREISQTGLGYSKDGTAGHAIGPEIAAGLATIAKEIIDAGITDPDLFTLLGLLQEGVGPDLISDMTVDIILSHIAAFSQRVAQELGIRTRSVAVDGQNFQLPLTSEGKFKLLVPAALLRKLPVAYSWDDIDTVSSDNAALRGRVNERIGDTWQKATSSAVKKKELRDVVLKNPTLMQDLIDQYHKKHATAYDLTKDPQGVQIWHDAALELAASHPLNLTTYRSLTPAKLLELAETICERFKQLVEDNRLGRLLYNDDGTARPEKTSQLFFYALATSYCDANDLDITPEADAGAGPVDFKISRGARAKVHVEVKLSSNQRLAHGYETQLPVYNKADRTEVSILLVVRTDDKDAQLKRVTTLAAAATARGERVPRLIVVDGRPQASASKRKA
jgi:hypothetical protein